LEGTTEWKPRRKLIKDACNMDEQTKINLLSVLKLFRFAFRKSFFNHLLKSYLGTLKLPSSKLFSLPLNPQFDPKRLSCTGKV